MGHLTISGDAGCLFSVGPVHRYVFYSSNAYTDGAPPGRSQRVAWCTDGALPGRSQGATWTESSGVRELPGVLTVLRLAGVRGVLGQCHGGKLCVCSLWPRGQKCAILHPFDDLLQQVGFMMLALQGHP